MVEPPRHPFLQGLSKHRGTPPTLVVIFGASGDLCARKLVPAIYNLAVDNLLSADFYLIGYGRKAIADDAFRQETQDDIKKFSRRPLAPVSYTHLDVYKRQRPSCAPCLG